MRVSTEMFSTITPGRIGKLEFLGSYYRLINQVTAELVTKDESVKADKH